MILTWLSIAAAVLLAMLVTYKVMHHFLPTWGTVLTNGLAGLMALISAVSDSLPALAAVAEGLPWATVISDQQALSAVMFAITAANGVIRAMGPKYQVGSNVK